MNTQTAEKPTLNLDITEQEKADLHAYAQAYKRAKILAKRTHYRYEPDQKNTDQLTLFTTKRSAHRAHRKIAKALIEDLAADTDLFCISNDFTHWNSITRDKTVTLNKLKTWTSYLSIGESMYAFDEFNDHSHTSYLAVSHYRVEECILLPTVSGWYDGTGRKLTTLEQKLDTAFKAGYLLSNSHSPRLVRPRGANRHDIEFMEKLIGFYKPNSDQGGRTLRNDLTNTLRRFVKNYNWPNKQAILQLL